MVVIRSDEASSSACYDVFLSFRGEDTRKTFTDHLYTALNQQGFRTFRDDDEMEKGEYLKSELEKAIPQSKSSIIVISKDYASSKWCLDELVMILEERRNSKHVVLPVFYHIDPSEVRKQTGRTAKAFASHEEKLDAEKDSEGKRKWMEKIRRWRSALTEVADLNGLDFENQVDGHESKFIQKIVKVIADKLRGKTLDVAPYEIGIDSRAKHINMWVEDGSTDVSVCVICGMGGIGKTTIAKYVYNQNSKSFDSSSFLANINEESQQPYGFLKLQRQLLSDISGRKHGKIQNVHEGLARIKNLVCYKRVLLVLDDVEQADQVYTISGMHDWLFPGSKVIITTRNKRLLKPDQIYKVKQLDEDESIKLFSLYAFGEDHPCGSYKKHTKRVAQICEGLPLALKVIGRSLLGKSEDEWVSQLAKLEAIPHSDIVQRLKISYDSLQDDYDRKLFLDIVCFFIGTNEDYAITILDKCGLHAKIGIQNLIDRCLLERRSHKVLGMHRLIQEMGREIIHQESDEAGERSRLWHHGDAFSILKNETGTNAVEGLTLDIHMLEEAGNNAKRRYRYEEFLDEPISLKLASSLMQCISFIFGQSISITLTSPNGIHLRTDAFKSMTKLRLLKLSYVELMGSYENFPKRLVWLSWHGFQLKSIPVEFTLESLVALDLRHSKLEHVWKKTPFLGSLKILDLSYSTWLARTPDFLHLPNLERLILKGCMSLVEVCESIGELKMLDLLDLQDCKTLRKLPRNIGKLVSLRILVISGCNIVEFPSEMKNMKSLEVITAEGININPLQTSSGEVKLIQQIFRSMVPTPRKGPETLWTCLPYYLKSLSLSGSNLSDDSFPENFGNLPSLSDLDLSKNQFRRLPNCIRSLKRLKYLNLYHCHSLQSLDLNGLMMKSGCIDVTSCRSLEKVMSLSEMVDLWLIGCYKMVGLEDYLKEEDRRRDPTMQVMFDYGQSNIYFEANTDPIFPAVRYQDSSAAAIRYMPPLLIDHRTQCLNVWCSMSEKAEISSRLISNEVQISMDDVTWIETPNYFPKSENVGWLSRWRFGNQLEAGHESTVTFDIADVYKLNDGFKVVYRDAEEANGSASAMEESHHNSPTKYFVARQLRENPDEDIWFPKRLN
ncbi:hypothetical protein LguiB_020927 [Lonicera macranthoides]